MKRWTGLIAGILLSLPGVSLALEALPLPAGAKPITTDELKALFDRGEKFLLVNSLSPLEYTQTKIPGSVNLPYGHLRDGSAQLPADRQTRLVFYCHAPQ